MNKYLKYELVSTFSIMILGVLLHFAYDWSNHNIIISLFSSINESVWEHLKLIFYPTVLMTIIGNILFKGTHPNYLNVKTYGLLWSLILIIVFFYTYSGILGRNIAFIDITSFFITVFIGQIISYRNKDNFNCSSKISIIFLVIMVILFTFFTFYQPPIGLFQ